MRVELPAAALLVLLAARTGATMSVDEAYAAIPHRRTVFDQRAARMSSEESDGLAKLFALVDRAIVARMTKAGHDAVLADLRALELPKTLRGVQALVIDAVRAERAYLVDGDQGGVQRASAQLHAAYAELMRLFPEEAANNRDAFFDYLCALDFL